MRLLRLAKSVAWTAPDNRNIHTNKLSVRTIVYVSYLDGYTFFGLQILTCQGDGKWDNLMPDFKKGYAYTDEPRRQKTYFRYVRPRKN